MYSMYFNDMNCDNYIHIYTSIYDYFMISDECDNARQDDFWRPERGNDEKGIHGELSE